MKRILPLLLLIALPVLVSARLIQSWSYQEMFDKADLVVIAKPVATKDTAETSTLPDIGPEIKLRGLAGYDRKWRAKEAAEFSIFLSYKFQWSINRAVDER